MLRFRFLTCLIFALSSVAAGASAAMIDINSYDNGWYRNDGVHSGNTNIFEGPTYNNYFAYDLGGLSGTVTAATLTIFGGNGTYNNSDSSVTYDMYEVTTSVNILVAGTGGVSAYNDLQSGTLYGSTNIATATSITSMPTVTVDLLGALVGLNSSLGGLFAVGGNSDASLWLWAASNGILASKLTLEVSPVAAVPIPAAAWLFGSGLIGLVGLKRRQRS